ncbi:MAG: VWA domain-containing protein [Endomicrobium sp.]|uniref:vWA domain-containing protein n=1 Tax=Candidatus Endomicrobiellum pyrsonymphae TaxID=1408203 RepID=UPI003572D0AF|nr:VWA domain-containing protein [Endomicrobium sp.]
MFADKVYLLLLFLMPILIFFFFVAFKKRKAALNTFVSSMNMPILAVVNLKAYKVKYILLLVGLFFVILALARPQYGEQKRTVIKESSEIVVALDVSKSMLAQDSKPNRLEQAKLMVLRVVEESPGEKMGVIIFSGTAMWQCPMTYDLQALKIFLQSVEAGSLPFGGTQISDAIILASKAVSGKTASERAMLLISDGEDHDSRIKEALNIARKAELKIISVGIGTHEGSPIPLRDETGTIRDYVKDRNGQIVVSKANSILLKSIADETGGKYFDASDKDISPILIKAVRDLDKTNDEVSENDTKTDRFQIFLLFGLIALFVALLFPVSRKK